MTVKLRLYHNNYLHFIIIYVLRVNYPLMKVMMGIEVKLV